MTFEQAIRNKFGKTLPQVPADYAMRKFRIDGKLDGFVIRMDDCGAFGNLATGEAYAWGDYGVESFRMGSADNKKPMRPSELAFERLIIQCAIGLIDRGEQLSDADIRRFGLAIQRTENANV